MIRIIVFIYAILGFSYASPIVLHEKFGNIEHISNPLRLGGHYQNQAQYGQWYSVSSDGWINGETLFTKSEAPDRARGAVIVLPPINIPPSFAHELELQFNASEFNNIDLGIARLYEVGGYDKNPIDHPNHNSLQINPQTFEVKALGPSNAFYNEIFSFTFDEKGFYSVPFSYTEGKSLVLFIGSQNIGNYPFPEVAYDFAQIKIIPEPNSMFLILFAFLAFYLKFLKRR